jgi:hypothetical protein
MPVESVPEVEFVQAPTATQVGKLDTPQQEPLLV